MRVKTQATALTLPPARASTGSRGHRRLRHRRAASELPRSRTKGQDNGRQSEGGGFVGTVSRGGGHVAWDGEQKRGWARRPSDDETWE